MTVTSGEEDVFVVVVHDVHGIDSPVVEVVDTPVNHWGVDEARCLWLGIKGKDGEVVVTRIINQSAWRDVRYLSRSAIEAFLDEWGQVALDAQKAAQERQDDLEEPEAPTDAQEAVSEPQAGTDDRLASWDVSITNPYQQEMLRAGECGYQGTLEQVRGYATSQADRLWAKDDGLIAVLWDTSSPEFLRATVKDISLTSEPKWDRTLGIIKVRRLG